MRILQRITISLLATGCGTVAPTATDSTTHTLTVARIGTGMGSVSSSTGEIACGDTCTAMVPRGTMVTLVAIPDATSTFVGWSGGSCSGTGECTITLDGDTIVASEFVPLPQNACPGSITFDFTVGTIQGFMPPTCATRLVIDASGAQGGGPAGGKGARIVGTFPAVGPLHILVGGQGSAVTSLVNGACAGGGGGSFVYLNADDATPLIAAGGGGGGLALGAPPGEPGGPGSDVVAPTNGTSGAGNAPGGTGGAGGAGGTESAPAGFPGTGGGGAGWLANGANGTVVAQGGGGSAPRSGGAGGAAGTGANGLITGAPGGFGGGGGAAGNAGASGGGGGFNGGGGGNGFNGRDDGTGGGGGSFNAGTDPMAMAGVRSGNGIVIISWQ